MLLEGRGQNKKANCRRFGVHLLACRQAKSESGSYCIDGTAKHGIDDGRTRQATSDKRSIIASQHRSSMM